MGHEKIEEGAQLDVGIYGSDTNVISYVLDGFGDATKGAVIAEIPGDYGKPSDDGDAPNAILIRKRFVRFLDRNVNDNTWSALGLAIYRSNIGFSGGNRPASGYARRFVDLDLPVYQRQAITGAFRRIETRFYRPFCEKVKVVTVDEFSEDILTEKIDPLVGAITRFAQNGHPYILIGADTNWTPGSPKTVEYRFQTTGSVPEFDIGSMWRNDIRIPALPALAQYAIREEDGQDPDVQVANVADELEEFDLTQLPGF